MDLIEKDRVEYKIQSKLLW